MRDQSTSEENSAVALGGFPTSRASWRVAMVEAREGYRLAVRFLDGVEGTVDLSDLITSPMAGVFTDLCDKAVFASARVEGGAVTWTNGLDLAPDAMYRAIRKTGLFQPKADVAA